MDRGRTPRKNHVEKCPPFLQTKHFSEVWGARSAHIRQWDAVHRSKLPRLLGEVKHKPHLHIRRAPTNKRAGRVGQPDSVTGNTKEVGRSQNQVGRRTPYGPLGVPNYSAFLHGRIPFSPHLWHRSRHSYRAQRAQLEDGRRDQFPSKRRKTARGIGVSR